MGYCEDENNVLTNLLTFYLFYFMKKMFFYAALASVAFASCTKESGIELPSNNEEMNEAAERIEFKMHNNINVSTRSTGAVGDTVNVANNKNVWNNQKLNVFMLYQDSLGLAMETFYVGDEKKSRAIFNDAEVIAPAGSDSVTANYGYEAKYYPATGAYDFFAYYDDDAAGATHIINKALKGTTTDSIMTLEVTINGAQDLMVSKATPSEADKAKYLKDAGAAKIDAGCERFYSAYTARRGIQPVLTFEHLLTRFVFNVSADSKEYCDSTTGITIDSIAIVNLPYKGAMTVAYTGAKPALKDMIAWGKQDTDTTTLWLQQRYAANEAKKDTVCKLLSVTPKWNVTEEKRDTTRIGESLLVPTQDEYELVIYYSQRPNAGAATAKPEDWNEELSGEWVDPAKPEGWTNDEWEKYTGRVYNSVYTKTITPKDNKPGTQYNVFFTVYGLEKIELDVKLTAWENGEDIDIDNDEF